MMAVVLAAGLSKRMKEQAAAVGGGPLCGANGSPYSLRCAAGQKLLMPFAGSFMLDVVLRNVIAASFERVCLVTSDEVQQRIGGLYGHIEYLQVVLNKNPERGQSSSLVLGVEAVSRGCDFCVMLGDQPLVTAEDIIAQKEIFTKRDSEYTALVPWREGRIGHPVFFSHIWRERLASAAEDVGGRFIVAAYPNEVLKVHAEDSFFTDIDTLDDYESITGIHCSNSG